MSSIPSNLARVPNLLSTQIMLGSITGTNQRLLNTQVQFATGRLVNRPSDNAIAASTISVLDDFLEQRDQRLRNLSHAQSVLDNADASLSDASEIMLEAKSIGLSQIGIGSDAETRANQAHVIDSMLNQMVRIANRKYQQIHLFGGNATANQPFIELLGGIRYQGVGNGLVTDTGLGSIVPITSSGAQAFGAQSARVNGSRDLDPAMIASTRLADLSGARGLGVAQPPGSLTVNVGGTDVIVDLSTAHTVGDAAALLQNAIAALDPTATVTIDPVSGNRLAIAGNTVSIDIADLGSPAIAADLGLVGTYAIGGGLGGDVNPRLTELTQLSSIAGLTVPLGTIRISNAGQNRDLDLSGATTVRELMNLVEGLDIGVHVEIAASGDRLNFVNVLSGSPSQGMSIAEVGGGTTATELGVRSFDGSTLLADFNNGLGVQIRSGSVDPITGLPDPAQDLDFRITLKDGQVVDVDLAGAITVQDVLDKINQAAIGAGVNVPADFQATLASTGNGITFLDNTAGGVGNTTIQALNGSFAATDLGLLPAGGSFSGASFTGEDRATVAVQSVFTHLRALRDALLANDDRGISLATQKLEDDIVRLAAARADVGVRAQQVSLATDRESELKIQDLSFKSQLQDLDYTEAAVRFSTLQQQLQAAMLTTARTNGMSLLDFLR